MSYMLSISRITIVKELINGVLIMDIINKTINKLERNHLKKIITSDYVSKCNKFWDIFLKNYSIERRPQSVNINRTYKRKGRPKKIKQHIISVNIC